MTDDYLKRWSVELGGRPYELNPEEELKMSEETINEDVTDQPSRYAFYAVLEEVADKDLADAKMVLDVTVATLDSEYRAKAVKENSKLTETQLLNQIKLDDKFLSATAAVNEARKNVGILRAYKEAFAQRKDMLITLASNMRIQSDPEIFLKKKEAQEALKG